MRFDTEDLKTDQLLIKGLNMPQIICTPESWFREKKTDIYQIDFDIGYEESSTLGDAGLQKLYKSEKLKLQEWLDSHLSEVQWTVLGPSEYSGYIMGGPALKSAELTHEQIQIFQHGWQGHPYWRLVHRPYGKWRSEMNRFRIWDRRSPLASITNWADLPGRGLMAIVAESNALDENSRSWLSAEDAYFRFAELLNDPMAAPCEFTPQGRLYQGSKYTFVMYSPLHEHRFSDDPKYWCSVRYSADKAKIEALRQFFNIDVPLDQIVVHEDEF